MVLNTTNGMFDVWSVARSAGFALSLPRGSWGSAALHPRAGSPAEHLGWGARLYAVAALRGLRQIQLTMNLIRASWSTSSTHLINASSPRSLILTIYHRFEETRWESLEADILIRIVRRNLHQVVRSVWVNLNGVIPAPRLIQDLPDRAHTLQRSSPNHLQSLTA